MIRIIATVAHTIGNRRIAWRQIDAAAAGLVIVSATLAQEENNAAKDQTNHQQRDNDNQRYDASAERWASVAVVSGARQSCYDVVDYGRKSLGRRRRRFSKEEEGLVVVILLFRSLNIYK